MLLDGNKTVKNIDILSDVEIQRVRDFLQGAIYCWCKNRKDFWFGLRDLMGGENFFWQGTPLYVLYSEHVKVLGNSDASITAAAMDAGLLLKKVLYEDKRGFNQRKEEGVNKYKWSGEEDNDEE